MILEELHGILKRLRISAETAVFSNKPPAEYAVLTPLTDTYEVFADDRPECEVCEVRITLYTKGNYLMTKFHVEEKLLRHGFTVTLRRYSGYDTDTGYHSYTIDVQKQYLLERNDP